MKAATGRRPSAKSKGMAWSVSSVLVAVSNAPSPGLRMAMTLKGIVILFLCFGSVANAIPAAMNT